MGFGGVQRYGSATHESNTHNIIRAESADDYATISIGRLPDLTVKCALRCNEMSVRECSHLSGCQMGRFGEHG